MTLVIRDERGKELREVECEEDITVLDAHNTSVLGKGSWRTITNATLHSVGDD